MIRRTPLRQPRPDPQAAWQERERNRLVKERAGWRCEGCGQALAVHVHHVWRRQRVTVELTHDPACLAAVCWRCHDELHQQPNGALDRAMMALAVQRLTGAPLADGENAMDRVRSVERERGLR